MTQSEKVPFYGKISLEAKVRIDELSGELGLTKAEVVDCLVRVLTYDQLCELVNAQLARDELEAAAWSRARPT